MNILKIAKKCKVNNYPEWCGCLQPAEIVALVDSGLVKVDKYHDVDVQRSRDNKAKGISNVTWFYFYPNDEFIEMNRGMK